MPELRITTEPVDIGAEYSLDAGDIVDIQIISGIGSAYLRRSEDPPLEDDRGIKLNANVGTMEWNRPYPISIPNSPDKLWVWSGASSGAEVALIIRS